MAPRWPSSPAVVAVAVIALGGCALVAPKSDQRTFASPHVRGLVDGTRVRLPNLGAGGMAALPAARNNGAASTGPSWGHATTCVAVLCAFSFAKRAASHIVMRGKAKNRPYYANIPMDMKFASEPGASKEYKDNGRMGYRIRGGPGRRASPRYYIPKIRWVRRFRRRISIRKRVEGTCTRPRMAVFRAHRHIYVNIVDDTIGTGRTLLAVNTMQGSVMEGLKKEQGVTLHRELETHKVEAAEFLGKEVAKKCLENNITQVAFDRGGFNMSGRVMALREAARSAGLQV